MGPYSKHKQIQRADSIKNLLDTNPQMCDYMKAVWKKHLMSLATNEDEYLARVKQVYSLLKPKHRGWISYE
tara:strand:- start:226 stop:438 length:213 start_codon:yes stop_codon:yes gene_type:complete